MHVLMLTQAKYIDFLLSTPRNYTGTHLAAHLPEVSHDQVTRFLRDSAFSSAQLRELVLPLLHDSPEAFLRVDDSVQDKRYSRLIEVAKRQYSGTVHGMVTGIGLVNLVHSSGEAGDFLPLDFRVYAPEQDQLTKNDHFQAMFRQVVADGNVQARTLLFDCWYAGSANLKLIHRAGWTFFTTLKSNRLVSVRKETGIRPWIRSNRHREAGIRRARCGCRKCPLQCAYSSWLPQTAALNGPSVATTWPRT